MCVVSDDADSETETETKIKDMHKLTKKIRNKPK
jgi:hypothetical protein